MGQEFTRSFIVISPGLIYDRFILCDDMEDLLKWTAVPVPAGGTATLDDTDCYVGNKSLKLVTNNGAPLEDDIIGAFRRIPSTWHKKITFSCLFKITETDDLKYLGFYLSNYAAPLAALANIYYNVSDQKWYYYTASDTYAVIDDIAMPIEKNFWYRFSMTIDLATLKYVSFCCASRLVDMSSIDMFTVAELVSNATVVHIELTHANTVTEAIAHFDNVIVESE